MAKQKKCLNYDVCGNYKPPISRVSGLCNSCASEKIEEDKDNSFQERLEKKIELEQQSALTIIDNIRKFEEYVKDKIIETLSTDKVIRCKECGELITTEYRPSTYGFNVAHLISKGSDPSMYYVRENSIFLCRRHHMQFDHGLKTEMAIYEETQKIKSELRVNTDYYKGLSHNAKFYK